MKGKNFGYTLVELMVALALGLIIVAAAVQLLYGAQKSVTFQKSIANLQENAHFGLHYVASDLKHTNLNLPNRAMKNNNLAGLIVNTSNYPSRVVGATRVTSSSGNGLSFTTAGSDILVIQYKPTTVRDFDCEGVETNVDDVVVQRYYLRRVENNPNSDLALVCDAGRYNYESGTAVTGIVANTGGQIIMPAVDQFKVLVGVVNSQGQRTYMTLSQYANADASLNLRAESLQVGMIIRSVDSAGTNAEEQTQINILNTAQTVVKQNWMRGKYIRVPIEQTIALRNAIGGQ